MGWPSTLRPTKIAPTAFRIFRLQRFEKRQCQMETLFCVAFERHEPRTGVGRRNANSPACFVPAAAGSINMFHLRAVLSVLERAANPRDCRALEHSDPSRPLITIAESARMPARGGIIGVGRALFLPFLSLFLSSLSFFSFGEIVTGQRQST